MKDSTDSKVIQLLDLVWKGVAENKSMWSYRRLNGSMDDGLRLAIYSGMSFDIDDINVIEGKFDCGWWGGDKESYYSLAVECGNTSAAKALEKHYKRNPFFVNDVNDRKRDRVCIGSKFKWNGDLVYVTSFKDNEGLVIACSYTPYIPDDRGYMTGGHKVKSIYKITHEDLKTVFPSK